MSMLLSKFNHLTFALILFISYGFGQVASTTGQLTFDIDEDATPEMTLNSTGLYIGASAMASANLDVGGNAMIAEKLTIGSTVLQSANLHIQGTFGQSVTTITTSTANLNRDGVYLFDMSTIAGNALAFLPSAASVSGRMITIKKMSQEHELKVIDSSGAFIDHQPYLTLTSGTSYPHVTLTSDSLNWYILSGNSSTTLANSDNLMGYWSFDELNPSDNTVTDFSGRGHHGKLNTAISYVDRLVQGVSGNGLHIEYEDATTRYTHVEVDHHTDLDNTMGDMTLAAWYKPDNFSFEHFVLMKSNTNDNILGYMLLCKNTSGNLNSGRGDGTSATYLESSTSMSVGSWNHMAVTYSGTTVSLYLNGAAVGIGTNSKNFLTAPGNLFIGQKQGNVDGAIGTIDEVYIFNRALSSSEIQSLAQP